MVWLIPSLSCFLFSLLFSSGFGLGGGGYCFGYGALLLQVFRSFPHVIVWVWVLMRYSLLVNSCCPSLEREFWDRIKTCAWKSTLG